MWNFQIRCSERGRSNSLWYKSVDLTRRTIRILGIYFLYNTKLMDQKNNYKTTSNINCILKLLWMRDLSIAEVASLKFE